MGLATVAPAAQSATNSVPWHLDRINQRNGTLDGNADLGALTGAGVNIYVVDSGVLSTHEQFGGRVVPGADPVTSSGESPISPRTSDCDGHGTHVAGLAAGSTVGVARGATVIAVRVLNCNGNGNVENVVAALKWIRSHHVSGKAAVVNLSLGVDRGTQADEIDQQVREMLAEGIVVTVAAGNIGQNACTSSPGDVPGALTVAASTSVDTAASYSNVGPCVDLFAPGGDNAEKIVSGWFGYFELRNDDGNITDQSFQNSGNNSDGAWYFRQVGTSMAAPLVAGYAALLAQQQPSLCGAQISNAIVQRATPAALGGVSATTPNRLLYIDTAPVQAAVPGRASNIITTVSRGSVLVSWDRPCDGGSSLTKTTVSIFSGTKLVQTQKLSAGARVARFTGLKNGVQYRVRVQHHNGVGNGALTKRVNTVTVRTLRAGETVAVKNIGLFGGDLTLKWKVDSSSRKVCKVLTKPTRIRFLKAGICRVAITTIAGGAPAIHRLRVN
jgi:subtilisin family serine protease